MTPLIAVNVDGAPTALAAREWLKRWAIDMDSGTLFRILMTVEHKTVDGNEMWLHGHRLDGESWRATRAMTLRVEDSHVLTTVFRGPA